MKPFKWYPLGEWTTVSEAECNLAYRLCRTLDEGNTEVVSSSTLDINGNTDTTLMVVNRHSERLLFVKRLDGSVLVATDQYDYAGGDW